MLVIVEIQPNFVLIPNLNLWIRAARRSGTITMLIVTDRPTVSGFFAISVTLEARRTRPRSMQRMWLPAGRDRQKDRLPYTQAQLRHSPARKRGQYPCAPGTAGQCRSEDTEIYTHVMNRDQRQLQSPRTAFDLQGRV